jgi:hypothetical protein
VADKSLKLYAPGVKVRQPESPTDGSGDEYAEQHGTAHLPSLQAGNHQQSEQGQGRRGRGEITQPDDGARLGHDDTGVGETNEGYEQAHPARHRGEQGARHGIHDELAHTAQRQYQKRDTRQEYTAQRRLPGHTHALDHREGEVGVQAHARGHGQGIVGHQAHEDAAEPRGKTSGRGDGGHRHAGVA